LSIGRSVRPRRSSHSWNQLLADDGDGLDEIAVIPLGQLTKLFVASRIAAWATGLAMMPLAMSSSIRRMRIAVLAMARQSDVQVWMTPPHS